MKKLAALLMVFSLSMFSVGCEPADETETDPAPANGAVGADMDGDDTADPADPATTE